MKTKTYVKHIYIYIYMLLFWKSHFSVSALILVNMTQGRKIGLICACAQVDKALMSHRHRRIVRVSSIHYDSCGIQILIAGFFFLGAVEVFWRLCRAKLVNGPAQTTCPQSLSVSLLPRTFCWSSRQDPVITSLGSKFGCGKQIADECII